MSAYMYKYTHLHGWPCKKDTWKRTDMRFTNPERWRRRRAPPYLTICKWNCPSSDSAARRMEKSIEKWLLCTLKIRYNCISTSTWQITLWIMMTEKIRGHSGKNVSQKLRNNCAVTSRSCGTFLKTDTNAQMAQLCQFLKPDTNAQIVSFLSHLLRSSVHACARNCCSLLRSLW